MSVPVAFFGSSDSLYVADNGRLDSSNPIPLLVRTRPVAPAGAAMDCVFDRLFLALTWYQWPDDPHRQADDTVALTVTPIVDGRQLDPCAKTWDLARPQGAGGESAVLEHVLREQRYRTPRRIPIHGGPVTEPAPLTLAPRGTWVSFLVESPRVRGRLVLERLEVEWELARASKRRG